MNPWTMLSLKAVFCNSSGHRSVKRHICFVTREMPPVTPYGGIGTYVEAMAEALAERGHRVDVVSRADRPTSEVAKGGYNVRRVASQAKGILSVLDFAIKAAQVVMEIHRTDPLSLIEVPDYLGYGAILKATLPEVPLLIRHHGGMELEFLARGRLIPFNPSWYMTAVMEVASAAVADMATAVSASQSRIARLKHGLRRIPVTILPNPVPYATLRLEPRLSPPAAPPWSVLFVGRMDHNKRPQVAARAVADLAIRGFDVVFECIGPDTPAGRLMTSDLIKGAFPPQLRYRLVIRGRRPHHEVLEAMRRSVALCLLSRHEGFPMVVVEAMAMALPVIAARGTAMDEIVMDGVTGFLVDGSNPGEVADCLARLIESPDLGTRMGWAARERALQLYSPSTVAERYEREVLDRLPLP